MHGYKLNKLIDKFLFGKSIFSSKFIWMKSTIKTSKISFDQLCGYRVCHETKRKKGRQKWKDMRAGKQPY